LTAGVVTGVFPGAESAPSTSLSERWSLFAGGHPVPNEASLSAARAAFALLARADAERALVFFLISGGGSAMMEWPRDERVTLAELRLMNKVLVGCGASIAEINTVRRGVSSVKGGGLARRAPRATQITLIISDTDPGDGRNVASGPTIVSTQDADDAKAVIARYGLAPKLPPSVMRAVEQLSPPSAEPLNHKHFVLLDNEIAMAAAEEAAREFNFAVEAAHDLIGQHVGAGCALSLARLRALRECTPPDRVACLISGGEFACPVRGGGIGGRNAETVLRWAIELDAETSAPTSAGGDARFLVLSGGTDGIDGNSPAAGAFADEATLARARSLGLDAHASLDDSDAYTFFRRLGQTLAPGPTGTNVRDLRIMLLR
jgi:hydroxypyruvate reductase